MARSHMLHGNKRNSLALLARALDLSSHVQSPSSLSKPGTDGSPKLEVTPVQAQSLRQLLERLVLQYRALVELDDLIAAASPNKDNFKPPPMIERMNEYPAEGVDLTNLVTYPPQIQPIPVKPIFLDVAWNYIDYPGRPKKGISTATSENVEETASKPEPKKEAKKGWFGFGR